MTVKEAGPEVSKKPKKPTRKRTFYRTLLAVYAFSNFGNIGNFGIIAFSTLTSGPKSYPDG